MMLQSGDRLLPRLNTGGNPIANKYCEGKTKRTLKKGLKDLKPLRRKVWNPANPRKRGGRRTGVGNAEVRCKFLLTPRKGRMRCEL